MQPSIAIPAQAACMAVVLACAAAHAQSPSPPPPTATVEVDGQKRAISELQAAQLLMQGGRVEDAKKVLLALERSSPEDSQVLFLLGMIAVQQKDYDTAIRRFRKILVREPGVARVRLELARAFFLKKDWDNAERQFRFARSADLPAAAIANIDHYLYAIRRLRRWSINASVAVAPDTNLNAGPDITQLQIFGLPFQLSSQTRKQSGVGGALDLGGEWDQPLGQQTRLDVGADFHGLVYSESEFDDLSLSAFAGPAFLASKWELSPRLTIFRRWYGQSVYNQGVGGMLQGTYYVTPRFGLGASVGAQNVTFPSLSEQNGVAVSGGLNAYFTPNPFTLLSANGAVSRQNAVTSAYAYTAGQIALGYSRDLKGGISVSISPSLTLTRYDAPLAAFGVTRRDTQWTAEIAALDRRLDWYGFTPRVSYAFTHNASNIALYGFDRSRIELGVTRVF
jgi:Tfp pilus assembly protein PilF